MWLDKLKELKKETGLSVKQISDATMLSEKTVERIFAGSAKSPYVDTLDRIATALGSSLSEVLAETKAVVGTEKLAVLQESLDVANAELDMVKAENKVLQDKVVSLTAEIDLLRLKLEHKEEIIRLHNYYNKLYSK